MQKKICDPTNLGRENQLLESRGSAKSHSKSRFFWHQNRLGSGLHGGFWGVWDQLHPVSKAPDALTTLDGHNLDDDTVILDSPNCFVGYYLETDQPALGRPG